MTDTYGPFDGSAPWAQDQWYRHAAKWAPSGVNGAPATTTSTGDLPLTLTGLNFTVGVGRAWVRGGGFERTGSPASQPVAANTNASLSRRDRVVLRRDLSTKTIAPVLIQGTPAATPVAPAVQQVETGQWDLPLFSFLVPPNSGTAITGVIDERGWIRSTSDSICFLATAGRDAYFAAPGDGDTCIVGGYPHVYQGGAWRGVGPGGLYVATAPGDASTIFNTTQNVMSVSIPDPLFPYKLLCSGTVMLAILGSNVTVAGRILVNGTQINPSGPDVTNSNPTTVAVNQLVPVWGSAVSATLTGASTVFYQIFKTGTAGNGYQVSSSGYNSLTALVVPA